MHRDVKYWYYWAQNRKQQWLLCQRFKKKKTKKNPKLENIYRKEGTLKSDITNLNKEPNKTFRTEKDDDQN